MGEEDNQEIEESQSQSPLDEDVLEDILTELSDMSEGSESEDDSTVYEFEIPDYKVICVDPSSIGNTEDDSSDEDSGHASPDYARFLRKDEAVSGDPHHVEFLLKNQSDFKFPGGKFTGVEVSPGLGSPFAYPGTEVEIPEIEPGESHSVVLHITISQSGDLTIKGRLEPTDGGEVECDMKSDGKIGFGIRSVPREQLVLLDMVNDIRRVLND